MAHKSLISREPSHLPFTCRSFRKSLLRAHARSSSCTTPGSGLEITMAQLRARCYDVRFTLLSPFLQLALHTSDLLSDDDTQHCAPAIDATLIWPLATASIPERKRLFWHHSTWTYDDMSFLCITVMIGKNTTLESICKQDLDLTQSCMSVAFPHCWLQDLKAIDIIAEWALQLLYPLFVRDMIKSILERKTSNYVETFDTRFCNSPPCHA